MNSPPPPGKSHHFQKFPEKLIVAPVCWILQLCPPVNFGHNDRNGANLSAGEQSIKINEALFVSQKKFIFFDIEPAKENNEAAVLKSVH